jgi:hypothetical protein
MQFLSEVDSPMAAMCERSDCAVTITGRISTLIATSPVYDKHGNVMSGRDPNKTTESFRCSSCGKVWDTIT